MKQWHFKYWQQSDSHKDLKGCYRHTHYLHIQRICHICLTGAESAWPSGIWCCVTPIRWFRLASLPIEVNGEVASQIQLLSWCHLFFINGFVFVFGDFTKSDMVGWQELTGQVLPSEGSTMITVQTPSIFIINHKIMISESIYSFKIFKSSKRSGLPRLV